MIPLADPARTLANCHHERSLAVSKATDQAQSKDPYPAEQIRAEAGNLRIVALRDHEPIRRKSNSREAAEECSPRRKPWDRIGTTLSPEGAKENPLRVVHATASI